MTLQESGKEGFTAPMGCLTTTFKGLKSSYYSDAVSGDDFSLEELAGDEPCILCIQSKFEHRHQLAVFQRSIYARVIRARGDNPKGRRIGFCMDEAGQLGAFSRIPDLVTFLRTTCFSVISYTELSQLKSAFGVLKAAEILGAIQFKAFSSVGPDTANTVSDMCGDQTLRYDDTLQQQQASKQRDHAALKMLRGESIDDGAAEFRYLNLAVEHKDKKRRRLVTPSEVINFDGVIAFASRLLKGPVHGRWVSTFLDRTYNNLLLNNPWYGDEVRMVGRLERYGLKRLVERFGLHRKVVIEEIDPPEKWRSLPQYQQGHKLRYPRGARPTPWRVLIVRLRFWLRRYFK